MPGDGGAAEAAMLQDPRGYLQRLMDMLGVGGPRLDGAEAEAAGDGLEARVPGAFQAHVDTDDSENTDTDEEGVPPLV